MRGGALLAGAFVVMVAVTVLSAMAASSGGPPEPRSRIRHFEATATSPGGLTQTPQQSKRVAVATVVGRGATANLGRLRLGRPAALEVADSTALP